MDALGVGSLKGGDPKLTVADCSFRLPMAFAAAAPLKATRTPETARRPPPCNQLGAKPCELLIGDRSRFL